MGIKFHFLNVGHGDTTIIQGSDSTVTVVDMNRSNEFDEESAKEIAAEYKQDFEAIKNSGVGFYSALSKYYDIALDDPIAYIENEIGVTSIQRYVQTHPDLDHFSGFKALIDKFEIHDFWDTDHKNVEKTDFLNESDKDDWEAYSDYRKDGATYHYRSHASIGGVTGYNIFVFHPTTKALLEGDKKGNPDTNCFSYLTLIECGGFKVVLGGDVPEKYWKDLWGGWTPMIRRSNSFAG